MKTMRIISFLVLFSIVLSFLAFTKMPKTGAIEVEAETTFSDEDIIATCTVNGIERYLYRVYNEDIYLKIGQSDPFLVYSGCLPIKFDKYGTIWIIDSYDTAIIWYNYDLNPDHVTFYPISKPTAENPNAYVTNVESFILDENNEFVVEYKTFSGESYPILTLEEMKAALLAYTPTPTPQPSATPTATPGNTVTPSNKPNVTQSPSVTSEPTVTPTPKPNNTISIKKKGSFKCLSVGNKIVSQYKLSKKGVLKWKGAKKSKTVKGVKQVAFIKKSKNLIYMTKKGKVCTISPKGKTKTLIKKGAKKLLQKAIMR